MVKTWQEKEQVTQEARRMFQNMTEKDQEIEMLRERLREGEKYTMEM